MIFPSIFLAIFVMTCETIAAPYKSSTVLDTIQSRIEKKIPANSKASCSDVRFFGPRVLVEEGSKKKDSTPYLVAKCDDGKGGQMCSWMPLAACFANAHGENVYRR
ncbi:hypothetical protein CTAM01_07016 [Colletotrichum tamarilloi]|uniref:Uncharacterized protein n=1 Tax=Colletotrichum tamarilloi TaxID=1209934 RepID=A0ABQ9RAA5_9PEZI|nr:uncharacterized protein CTAM01_07016 [Colletotrichum tamarilloi]KAK1499095.1 hypothetical protein CTAM01_07016 [Colletotrichum tamarilloi]